MLASPSLRLAAAHTFASLLGPHGDPGQSPAVSLSALLQFLNTHFEVSEARVASLFLGSRGDTAAPITFQTFENLLETVVRRTSPFSPKLSDSDLSASLRFPDTDSARRFLLNALAAALDSQTYNDPSLSLLLHERALPSSLDLVYPRETVLAVVSAVQTPGDFQLAFSRFEEALGGLVASQDALACFPHLDAAKQALFCLCNWRAPVCFSRLKGLGRSLFTVWLRSGGLDRVASLLTQSLAQPAGSVPSNIQSLCFELLVSFMSLFRFADNFPLYHEDLSQLQIAHDSVGKMVEAVLAAALPFFWASGDPAALAFLAAVFE